MPTTGDIAADARASTGRPQRSDCGWRAGTDTDAALLTGGDCGLYWSVGHIADDQRQLYFERRRCLRPEILLLTCALPLRAADYKETTALEPSAQRTAANTIDN